MVVQSSPTIASFTKTVRGGHTLTRGALPHRLVTRVTARGGVCTSWAARDQLPMRRVRPAISMRHPAYGQSASALPVWDAPKKAWYGSWQRLKPCRFIRSHHQTTTRLCMPAPGRSRLAPRRWSARLLARLLERQQWVPSAFPNKQPLLPQAVLKLQNRAARRWETDDGNYSTRLVSQNDDRRCGGCCRRRGLRRNTDGDCACRRRRAVACTGRRHAVRCDPLHRLQDVRRSLHTGQWAYA